MSAGDHVGTERPGVSYAANPGCSGCEWLMIGRWAPWCMKAGRPLLMVVSCPSPRVPVYYEPMDVRDLVERAASMAEERRRGR